MCAASKHDRPRHFLSDPKALNRNGIFPEGTSLSSPTDERCRKVPKLHAQTPSAATRGVQLRIGSCSAPLLPGNYLPWEPLFQVMTSKCRRPPKSIDHTEESKGTK